MNSIRIATAVTNSPVGQVQSNLDAMAVWIAAAKKQNAAIICFPEMNITGYTTRREITGFAEPVPGPTSDKLQQMADEYNIVILAGLAESDDQHMFYASHLVVKPGNSVEIYRKLHIAPPEKAVFSAGNRIPLFEMNRVKFGIQLCYDAHFPELSTRMAADGADLIFMPHASPRGTSREKYTSWMRHLTARAFDNGVFIVANNQVGSNRQGLDFPGLSLAISPSGEIIKKRLGNQEGLMVVDLKADLLRHVRHHRMRYFLPYRRTDLFV